MTCKRGHAWEKQTPIWKLNGTEERLVRECRVCCYLRKRLYRKGTNLTKQKIKRGEKIAISILTEAYRA